MASVMQQGNFIPQFLGLPLILLIKINTENVKWIALLRRIWKVAFYYTAFSYFS
jgi:hypothetical protein